MLARLCPDLQTALAIVPPTSSSTSSSSSTLSVQYDDRLKERAFGSLEGHSFKGEKTDAIPGIESMEVLRKRLGSFWEDRLLAAYEAGRQSSSSSVANGNNSNGKSGKTRTIVVVGHGASLSCLLNVVAAQGYEMAEGVRPSRLWNCSITELLVTLKPSTSTQEEQWEDVDPSKDRSPSNGSSKLGKLRDTLLPRRTSQNGSSLPTSPTSPSFALFSRSVLVTRWADTRHLEEGFTMKTTQGDQDGAAGQQEAVGVSKEANADEIEVEEEEEERKPVQS